MSVQTKYKLKAWSKKFGLILFVVLFLFNIKVALMEDISNGDISFLGINITIFESTIAAESFPCKMCTEDDLCWGCDTGNGALLNFCCKWWCGDYSGVICGKCYDNCAGRCC